jgi:Sulfotransferase family
MRWRRRIRRELTSAGLLERAEKLLLAREWTTARPQLFILGLPRSGTTLVYQYAAHRFNVAYFTSWTGRFPLSPCVVTVAERLRHPGYSSDFRSRYGKIAGLGAPREAGSVWGRFFDPNSYQDLAQIDTRKIHILRQTVACLQRAQRDVPFINKNVKHMQRLPALAEIFPSARFLVVEREPADVALSLFRARRDSPSGPTQWWSVRPPDYEDLRRLSLPKQIAGQVASLKRRLNEDIARLDSKRVLTIRYEEFCRQPEKLTDMLEAALSPVSPRNTPMGQFPVARNRPSCPMECAVMAELERVMTDPLRHRGVERPSILAL